MPQCFQATRVWGAPGASTLLFRFYACHGAFLLMDPTAAVLGSEREEKKLLPNNPIKNIDA